MVHRKSVVEETTALLSRRVPLYEPAFAAGEGFARIDILVTLSHKVGTCGLARP